MTSPLTFPLTEVLPGVLVMCACCTVVFFIHHLNHVKTLPKPLSPSIHLKQLFLWLCYISKHSQKNSCKKREIQGMTIVQRIALMYVMEKCIRPNCIADSGTD